MKKKHYHIYYEGKLVAYYNNTFKQTIKELEAEGFQVVQAIRASS